MSANPLGDAPIPARFRVLCALCNDPDKPIDTRWTETIYERLLSWHKKRTAGGAHGNTLAEPTNEWAHATCVEKKVREHERNKHLNNTPFRYRRVLCAICKDQKHPINTGWTEIYERSLSWHKKRADGGAHGNTLAEPTNEWAHETCVEDKAKGHNKQFGLNL